jgi:PTH1 family peptidyl-tRNA hydrolase
LTTIRAVVGLGNPGGEYARTYHNIGFMVVDHLASTYSHDAPERNGGELYPLNDGPVDYLGKPGRYVNRSGEVVADWSEIHDWSPEEVLVVYDDFSLDVGELRVKPSGSAGGHNGMKDVIDRLGTNQIPRVRVGIGPVSPGGDPAEFVLSQITRNDHEIFRHIFAEFPTLLDTVVADGFQEAMNRYNGTDFDE